jgi:hypothetical protein
MMSDRTGAFVFVIGWIGALVATMMYEAFTAPPEPPPAVYLEDRVYTPSEATVEVSAYFNGLRTYGKGIVIRHSDRTFVLTSSMIVAVAFDKLEVKVEGETYNAYFIDRNDSFGLVALECELGIPFVELNGDPNIPPLVPVGINGWSAWTLEYINDDWVLLGDLPEGEDCTGKPVVQNGELIGIIVGMNRINRDQAIMVGNRALNEFVKTLGGGG